MRRTVPLAPRAWIVGAVISALILAIAPAAVLGTGAPLFQPYQAIPAGFASEAVAVGDVTGDFRNDVVMTTSFAFDPAKGDRLWVFAQAPDGTLRTPVSYPTAGGYNNPERSIAVGDITGDGKADVLVGVTGIGIQLFAQLPNGKLGAPTLYPAISAGIRLGQLNGDRLLDVAGFGPVSNTVGVLLNDGHGGFLPVTSYPAAQGGELEVADVSGDGLDDLVVMTGLFVDNTPNISVLAQLPAGGFGTAAEYRILGNRLTQGIGVGDVTGDGRNDVVASYGGNRPDSYIAVFAQTTDGALEAPVYYPSYDIPVPIDVADLDLDGRADVVTLHSGFGAAGVYRQQPDGSVAPEERYDIPHTDYHAQSLAVGDINSDGAPDVVVADYSEGLVVLRNTSTPPPPPPDTLSALTAPQVWVGLKNSDDVGLRLDLRAEVYLGNTLVTYGETNSVTAGSSGFPRAVLDDIPLRPFAPVAAPHGSRLSVKLFVRNSCTGSMHSSGVARLWYNDRAANSAFGATISGSRTTAYLVVGSNLSTSPGTGPKATVDAAAGAKCSAFKSFGAWSLLVP
jgi:FG-GAP-like repeat